MTLTSPLGSEPVERKRSKVDVVGLIPDTAAVSRCGVGMGRPSCGLWTQNQSELPGLSQASPWAGPSLGRLCPLQAGEVGAACMHLRSSLKHLRQGTPSGAGGVRGLDGVWRQLSSTHSELPRRAHQGHQDGGERPAEGAGAAGGSSALPLSGKPQRRGRGRSGVPLGHPDFSSWRRSGKRVSST